MAHANEAVEELTSPSIDPEEIEKFSAMADEWWDPDGKFKPLHKINPLRLNYIRDTLTRHFGLDADADQPLKGLRLLDIGCGGGLLSEPLARLGAEVVGVDAAIRNVKTAKAHAEKTGVKVDFRHGTIELLAESGEKPFDTVLNMEVVEHVSDPAQFLKTSASVVKPGGLMLVSTINRTSKAFVMAIFGAEYVLGWLPKGTHQFDKLVKPEEIEAALAPEGYEVGEPVGVSFNPLSDEWRLSGDTSVNYMTVVTAPKK